jgi:hypothetical protein
LLDLQQRLTSLCAVIRGEPVSIWKRKKPIELLFNLDHPEELVVMTKVNEVACCTFYKWRAKYAGLEVSDVKKLRQLEDENRRLKQMVAEQALDIQALKAITAKNW